MRVNLFFEKKIALSTVLLFFSGFSALIYQVIWQRILSQEIGIDSLAMAITVAVFMTGLGFGSIVGGIASKRLKKNIFFCLWYCRNHNRYFWISFRKYY